MHKSKSKNSSVQISCKNPDFQKVNMRQYCCDSLHAAVAPGAINCHNNTATAPGEGNTEGFPH